MGEIRRKGGQEQEPRLFASDIARPSHSVDGQVVEDHHIALARVGASWFDVSLKRRAGNRTINDQAHSAHDSAARR